MSIGKILVTIAKTPMSIGSPLYLGFLALTFILFQFFPKGAPRRTLLIFASYIFYIYMCGFYAVLLIVISFLAYQGALYVSSRAEELAQKRAFSLLCVLLLSPLLLFKYLSAGLVALGLDQGTPFFHLILPVGISFFTFTALGYVIDVYLGVVEAEHKLDKMFLFLAFFPLITAGPIERAGRMLPQLECADKRSWPSIFKALNLIFIGLVLKLFFADTLAVPISSVLDSPEKMLPLEKLFAVFFYMYYMYADFAGYSLIAIGSALLLGIKVNRNFHQPFLSSTIPEFWRNWHISLSSWVRDYIWFPLQMQWRSYGVFGMAGTLTLSFLIIGIWHGAKWGFACFGLMHALLAIGSGLSLPFRNRLIARLHVPQAAVLIYRIAITNILVMLALVFFREGSVKEAVNIYSDIFSLACLENIRQELSSSLPLKIITSGSPGWLIIGVIMVGDIVVRRGWTLERFPRTLRYTIYWLGSAALAYSWLSEHVQRPFVYYQF